MILRKAVQTNVSVGSQKDSLGHSSVKQLSVVVGPSPLTNRTINENVYNDCQLDFI